MLNILTIDIEDYFQVHALSNVIKYEEWDKFECRVERNTDRILEILNSARCPYRLKQQRSTSAHEHFEHRSTAALNNSPFIPTNSEFKTHNSPKGTFFVLGWIAERYPELIRRVQKEGHEIACHGYGHKLLYCQSKEDFRNDIRRAKAILEDITGIEIIGYRAPSYSITNKSQWALEILAEEGFQYDSSIFPIRHDFYGMPNAPRFPFLISLNGNQNVEFSVLNYELEDSKPITQNSKLNINNSITHSRINSNSLIEFPISTVRILGQNFPIGGGGYFRLFPYSLIKKGLRSINKKESKPFIFYVHPWEFDPDQPRINNLPFKSRFRHYVNLTKTEEKFKKLIEDFQFSTIRQILIQNSQFKTRTS